MDGNRSEIYYSSFTGVPLNRSVLDAKFPKRPIPGLRPSASYCWNSSLSCELCVGYVAEFPFVVELGAPLEVQARYAPRGGYLYELTRIICQIMQLRCCFVRLPHNDFGVRYKGQRGWNGIVQDILDGSIDTSVPNFYPNEARRQALRFTETVYHVRIGFGFRPRPEDRTIGLSDKATFLQEPFTRGTWGLLGALVGVFLCLLAWASVVSRERGPRAVAWHGLMSVVNVLLLVKGESLLVSTAGLGRRFPAGWRGLYLTLTLGTMLVTTFYAATLASRSIAPPVTAQLSDLAALADRMAQGRYRLATHSMSNGIYQHIMESEAPAYAAFTQAIRRFGASLIPANVSEEDFLWEAAEAHVVIGSDRHLESSLMRKSCAFLLLTAERELQDRIPFAFPLHPNSSLGPRFQYAINAIRPLDILRLLMKRYTVIRKCSSEIEQRILNSQEHQLSMNQLKTAFLPIVFGAMVALIVFYREMKAPPKKACYRQGFLYPTWQHFN